MSDAPGDPARPPSPLPDPDGVPTTVTRRHAAPQQQRSMWAILVPTAVALVMVLALVGAWSTLQNRGVRGPNPPLAAVDDIRDVVGVPGAGRPSPSHPTSTPGPSTPAPSATRTKPPKKPTTEPTTAPRWDRTVPVGVLNATSRPGLAAQVAARLRALGWTVVAVANWRADNVHRTTAFTTRWPRAVRTLRHDVPAVKAVRAPLPQMSTDRIVLVLADDYP